MKIVTVLLAGVAVFMVLTIAGMSVKRMSARYPVLKNMLKLLPLAKIIIWIAFVFWGTGVLFADGNIYTFVTVGLIFIITLLFVWFVFRDIFAGAIFRAQNELNKGDYIKIGNLSGQIKSVHLTCLEITSDNGQTIKIPNSRLSEELISGMTTPEGMEEFTIRLSVKNTQEKDEFEEKIKYEIANSPWCNYKNPPVIKFQKEDTNAGTLIYDVLVYTLNKQHLRKVEKNLKVRFGI